MNARSYNKKKSLDFVYPKSVKKQENQGVFLPIIVSVRRTVMKQYEKLLITVTYYEEEDIVTMSVPTSDGDNLGAEDPDLGWG